MDEDRVVPQLYLRGVAHQELRAEPLRLLAELDHQLRPQDPLGKTGVVLHIARDHQLPARGQPLHHQRLQIGPRRVDCRRQPGRT